MVPDATGFTRITATSVFVIGLIIALAGLANVLPTYGVLPRIGPFPVEWFRPLFFWLCILVFLTGDAHKRARDARLGAVHLLAYGIAAVAIYLTVILAVVIPALAYPVSLFLAAYFEAQKLGIEVTDEDIGVEKLVGQDWLNLLLVFGSIAIIFYLLVGGISAVGA